MLVGLTEILWLEVALIVRTRPHSLLKIGLSLRRRVILLNVLIDFVCWNVGGIGTLCFACQRADPFLIASVVYFLAFRWFHV